MLGSVAGLALLIGRLLHVAGGGGPFEGLASARVAVDSAHREIVIELPPADLPARPPGGEMAMVLFPVCVAEIPASGAIFRARIELVDSAGDTLSQQFLHHFNLSDPGRRELFLPIALHLMAASKETPAVAVPRFVFGLPLRRGQRLLTSAMLANTTTAAYRQVRVRLALGYEPVDEIWPLFPAYPWVMDVLFPLGHGPDGSKAFDLPPGRTERAFESSPAVPGTIVGLGGHLHDYAVGLELRDVTSGEVVWNATLVRDRAGHMLSIPVTHLYNWHRLGIHIVPTHRYRVTAVYENPTGHLIPDGAMGAVGGLFVPDRGVEWPTVDPRDTLYQRDLAATLRTDAGGSAMMLMMNMH